MRWRKELLLFGAAYLLYNAGRGFTDGDMNLAIANAGWVLDLEGGASMERSVQDAFGGVWMALLSHIYLAAQIVVLPGVLVAMYRWAPRIYPRLRDTVIVTWMLSLPVYALFPVAPPRLAGIGMTDAVSEQSAVALAGHSTWFYNPIAAVPSLHCGFAMALGVAVAAAVKRPLVEGAGAELGPDRRALDGRDRQPLRVRRRGGPGDHRRRLRHRRASARVPGGGVRMISVVVLDHHPATCAGVNAILQEHAGVVGVGFAADRRALWPLLYRTDPDVVVLDDLRHCLAVRARHPQIAGRAPHG